jgi:hypothetical protein
MSAQEHAQVLAAAAASFKSATRKEFRGIVVVVVEKPGGTYWVSPYAKILNLLDDDRWIFHPPGTRFEALEE